MHDVILSEIRTTRFYLDNFPNEGQRFVAWYLRRVLLLDEAATKAAITDGQDDKQIDAIVVEDGEEQRIRIVQGKFLKPEPIDAAPLREVLSAWARLKDLPRLQLECSGKLAERLETMRVGLDQDYDIQFELLTTGSLTAAARTDFEAFRAVIGEDSDLGANLVLVDTEMIEAGLNEAEQRELPELLGVVQVEPERCLVTEESGIRVALAMLPLKECLKLPGIPDGKLFRRNVRQSLGLSNKVNRALRTTLTSREKAPYLFFFHNGITALCKGLKVTDGGRRLEMRDIAVVNGCQSLSTMFASSGRLVEHGRGTVLFRVYEIPQRDLADEISINTNSQSAVKPRDLRSNDKLMLSVKRRYESGVPEGHFITKRGEERPAAKDPAKCVDAPDYARMVISWMAQRPNLASNEKRLFDEYYKTIFQPELSALSILVLRSWLWEIDRNWPQLGINEAVKAVRGSTRFHLLFAVSQLCACASNQLDKVPQPAATADSLKYAGVILNHAATCINQAVGQAHARTTAEQKIFSPQNWLKSKGAVSDEQLVAGTVVNVLKGMGTADTRPILESLKVAPDRFSFRWSAD